MESIQRIHHISAIVGNAQETYDFTQIFKLKIN